jgi:hypothetical protein
VLRYADVRGDLADGDVLLFVGRGRVSRLISWATRSQYTHAALVVRLWDRVMVAESRELRGCRLVPLSAALGATHVARFVPAPWATPSGPALVAAALDRLGQPYGWAQILRIGLAKLPTALLRKIPVVGRWIPGGRQWSEDDQDPNGPRMICSQYVAHCYRRGGVDLVHNLADRDTTPGDIARSAGLMFAGFISG